MYTVPDMTDFLVRKTSTLKEFLSLLPLLWQPTTAQLNPPHIFIFSYIEKVSIQSIFFLPSLNGFLWRPEHESTQMEVRIHHGAAHRLLRKKVYR